MLNIAQCYDGALIMSGSFFGIKKTVSEIIPHAIYTHCHARCLSLCLINSMKDIKLVNSYDNIWEHYKYLNNDHTSYKLLISVKKNLKKYFKVLYFERLVETRWSY